MEPKRRVEAPNGGAHDATEVGFRASGAHWNEKLLDDSTISGHKLVVPWADAAVRHAIARRSEDPDEFIATVTGVPGAWGAGATPDEALSDLHSVLIGWATLKLDDGDGDIPDMEGICLVAGT